MWIIVVFILRANFIKVRLMLSAFWGEIHAEKQFFYEFRLFLT